MTNKTNPLTLPRRTVLGDQTLKSIPTKKRTTNHNKRVGCTSISVCLLKVLSVRRRRQPNDIPLWMWSLSMIFFCTAMTARYLVRVVQKLSVSFCVNARIDRSIVVVSERQRVCSNNQSSGILCTMEPRLSFRPRWPYLFVRQLNK